MVQLRKREGLGIDRYQPDAVKETQRTVVQEGKGTKLSEIPNVSFKLDKAKGTDESIEQLHTILFRSKGKAIARKRDIKAFSGLVYEGDAEEEAKKVEARVNKLTLPQLHNIMDILDIPRGSGAEHTKEKKSARVVQFLDSPEVLNEKDLKAQAESKKSKAAAKKAKADAKKEKPAKRASAKKATPSKGVTKKEAPAKKSTAKKASTKKEPTVQTPTTGRKRKAAETEEKPSKKAKKTKGAASGWPSDEQLAKDVDAIVEDMIKEGDGTIVVKAVFEAVGTKYGLSKEEVQLKKAAIKGVLSKLQASNQADAEEVQEDPTSEEVQAEEEVKPNGVADPDTKLDSDAKPEPALAPSEPEPVEASKPEPEVVAPQEPYLEPEDVPMAETGTAEPFGAKEPTPEPPEEIEIEKQPVVEEPPSAAPSVVTQGKPPQADEITQAVDSNPAPVSTDIPVVEEPATEERPLIQTPATFEGDEITEPMETEPSSYVPGTVPESSTVPETLTETIKTNTVYSAPTQPTYPPVQVQQVAFDPDSLMDIPPDA